MTIDTSTNSKHPSVAAQITRRTALASLSAASYSRLLGANDRVQVGFIGYGLIGGQHVFDFKNQKDVDLAAMCDVYQPRLEQGVAATGQKAKPYSDFRKLLENKDLQAVVVCTPDHWHALMTMMACAAGKDVYVEKPLTLFVKEGRWMVDVARRHNRIVQVGTQQRSGRGYQEARALIQSGYIGQIVSVRGTAYRNIMPGFGSFPDTQPPNDFEYDMWLGPAPKRPYNKMRGLYHFRWFWDYSGGQMTNLGAHQIDIVHWFLNVKGPSAVTSTGGRLVLHDGGETPDVQDAMLEYPGFTMMYSLREVSAGRHDQAGLEFFGTKGSLTVSRTGWQVYPDMKIPPVNSVPQFKGQPTGGVNHQDARPESWIAAQKGLDSGPEEFDRHARNFIDCIKTRQPPIAGVEGGHQVTTATHLANLSLRTGRKLKWDVKAEQIIDDPQANAMLERPYRGPWDTVLRGLLA